MGKGYVIFVVSKNGYTPYFLEFYTNNPGATKNFITKQILVSDLKNATVYPVFEAAEVIYNIVKKDKKYLYVHIFDTEGNPCYGKPGANKGEDASQEDDSDHST